MTEKWGVVPHAEDGRILYIRKNGSDNYIDEVAVLYNQPIEKANLMAAAPDMAEVLSDIIRQVEREPYITPDVTRAEEALAKARGES